MRLAARHRIDGHDVAVVEREEDDQPVYELVVDGVRLPGDLFPVQPSTDEIRRLLSASGRFPPRSAG